MKLRNAPSCLTFLLLLSSIVQVPGQVIKGTGSAIVTRKAFVVPSGSIAPPVSRSKFDAQKVDCPTGMVSAYELCPLPGSQELVELCQAFKNICPEMTQCYPDTCGGCNVRVFNIWNEEICKGASRY